MFTKSLLFALLALPVFAAAQKTRITVITSHPVARSYHQTRITPGMALNLTPLYHAPRVYHSNGDAIGPFALRNGRTGSVHYYAPGYRVSRVPQSYYRVIPAIRARPFINQNRRPVYIQRSGRSAKRGVLN
jgi:hypothetical protein